LTIEEPVIKVKNKNDIFFALIGSQDFIPAPPFSGVEVFPITAEP
jgi:hypothetical protein